MDKEKLQSRSLEEDKKKDWAAEVEKVDREFRSEVANLFRGINAGLRPDNPHYLDSTNATNRRKMAKGVSAADRLRLLWAKKVSMPGYYKSHPYHARDLLQKIGLLPNFLWLEQQGPLNVPGVPIDFAHTAASLQDKSYVHPQQWYPTIGSPERKKVDPEGIRPALSSWTASLLDFYNRPPEQVLNEIVKRINEKLTDARMGDLEKQNLIDQRGQVIAARMWLEHPDSFRKFRLMGFFDALGHKDAEPFMRSSLYTGEFSDTVQKSPVDSEDFFFERGYNARADLVAIGKDTVAHMRIARGRKVNLSDEIEICYKRLKFLKARRKIVARAEASTATVSLASLKAVTDKQPSFWIEIVPAVLRHYQEEVDARVPLARDTYEQALVLSNEGVQLDQDINALMARGMILAILGIKYHYGELDKNIPARFKDNPDDFKKKCADDFVLKKTEWFRGVLLLPECVLRDHPVLLREAKEVFGSLPKDDAGVTPAERAVWSSMVGEGGLSPWEAFQESARACQTSPIGSLMEDPIFLDENEDEEFVVSFKSWRLFAQDIQRQIGDTPLEKVPIDSSHTIIFETDSLLWLGTFGKLLDWVRSSIRSISGVHVTRTQARMYLAALIKAEPDPQRDDAAIAAEQDVALQTVLAATVEGEEYHCTGEGNEKIVLKASYKNGTYTSVIRMPNGQEFSITEDIKKNTGLMISTFKRMSAVARVEQFYDDLQHEIPSLTVALKAAVNSPTKTKLQCEHLQMRAQLLYAKFEKGGFAQGKELHPELKEVMEWIKTEQAKPQQYLPPRIIAFMGKVDVLEDEIQKDAFREAIRTAESLTTDNLAKKVEEGIVPFAVSIYGGVLGAQKFREAGRRFTHLLRRGFLGRDIGEFASRRFGRRLIMGTFSNVGLGTGGYVASELNKGVMSQMFDRGGMESDFERYVSGQTGTFDYMWGVTRSIGQSAAMSAAIGWLGEKGGNHLRAALSQTPKAQQRGVYVVCRNFLYRRILRTSQRMNAFEDRCLKPLMPGARKGVDDTIQKELAEETGQEVGNRVGDDIASAFVGSIDKDSGIVDQVIGNAIAIVWAMGKKGKHTRGGIVPNRRLKISEATASSPKTYHYSATYLPHAELNLQREMEEMCREVGLKGRGRGEGQWSITQKGQEYTLEYTRNTGVKGKEKKYVHTYSPEKTSVFLRELYFASLDENNQSGLDEFGFKMGVGSEKDQCSVDGRKIKGIERFFFYQEIHATPVIKHERIVAFTLEHESSGRKETLMVDPPAALNDPFWNFRIFPDDSNFPFEEHK